MLNRRSFIKNTSLLTGASLVSTLYPESLFAAESNKTNLVFILCDDLGYGDLSCYGHPIIETPHLDALADEGVRFTDCYAAAPVCSPARAGVITGRNPYRCNIPDWIPADSPLHLQQAEVSIASLLKDAGYRTGLCGKWHLSGTMDGSQPLPGDHGYGHWFATQNNAAPTHHNPKNFYRNGEPVGAMEGYSSTLIVDESLRFLKEVKDQPFALFIWFHSPHEPIATAPEYTEKYKKVENEKQATYFGNVTQMDHEVGRFLKELGEMGLRENTLVLFTSDNGPETLNRYRGSSFSYGSPGDLRGMKLHLHEGGIRVPGILRWPGKAKSGELCSEPINGTDVLPTFCAIANASIPTDRAIDGANLLPALNGRSIQREYPLYWRYDRALSDAKTAMRVGEWKILADRDMESFELYNLAEDMKETNNLAQEKPDQLKEMIEQLREVHQSVLEDPISERVKDPRDG